MTLCSQSKFIPKLNVLFKYVLKILAFDREYKYGDNKGCGEGDCWRDRDAIRVEVDVLLYNKG
jgi:hypothetical protein